MNRMMTLALRLSSVLAVFYMFSALVQTVAQTGLTGPVLDEWLKRGYFLYPVIAAAAWLAIFAGLLYERKAWPQAVSQRWIVDILDRLTNKQKLENLIAGKVEPTFIDADALAAHLKEKVVGQDQVCEDVATQIRRRLALMQRGKPVGVFLLAGPPGTGKTYLGKRLAIELECKLLHFDMSQFSTPHAATQMFGSPKGYVGSDTYGKLTASLKETPDAVVLLDEFEKAHDEVHKKFLTAWNDGFITEASDGRQISTSRAIFIVTTNAATEALGEIALRFAGSPDELRRASIEALRQAHFAPEVLNRIDRIFVFAPLSGLNIARVAALEIEAMIEGYGLKVAEGGIDPSLLFSIMQRHDKIGPAASARDLVRAIEESISDSLIEAKQKQARSVILIDEGTRMVAEIAS